jgi:histone deacetylase 1/2
VFSDVWGHAQTSVSGNNYYVSFIDAYSRFTWLYLIKRKSDVFDVFIQFQAHVERLLKHKIVHVQSDWGVNITTSIRSLISLGSRTVCLAHIHINRMVLPNVSIVIL